jgi:hypothetical protein
MPRAKSHHTNDRGNPITPQQRWDRDNQFGKTDSPRDQKRRADRNRYQRDRYNRLKRQRPVSLAKAARYLEVTEEELIELLDRGVIVSAWDGGKCVVLWEAVLDYQVKRREAVLSTLVEQAQEFDMGY